MWDYGGLGASSVLASDHSDVIAGGVAGAEAGRGSGMVARRVWQRARREHGATEGDGSPPWLARARGATEGGAEAAGRRRGRTWWVAVGGRGEGTFQQTGAGEGATSGDGVAAAAGEEQRALTLPARAAAATVRGQSGGGHTKYTFGSGCVCAWYDWRVCVRSHQCVREGRTARSGTHLWGRLAFA